MSTALKAQNWLFKRIHINNLVYNTCWEDPRCDRHLLALQADSKVVMITSAGCNALSYLLDNPQEVHCIDMNPRQNALLELKLSLFKNTDYQTLFYFFGQGHHPDFQTIYDTKLRDSLPAYAQKYWDKNIRFFSQKGIRKSFYHHGTSGMVAWLISKYIKARKKHYRELQRLLLAKNLEEQKAIYYELEPKLLSPFFSFLSKQHFTMCLLGVPRSQQELFIHDYEDGIFGFIQTSLRNVFTKVAVHDNYFYKVYLDGKYTENCSPSYLKPDNFDALKQRHSRVHTYSTTISDFLKNNPGAYSHYVLLDHQDWLAANDQAALDEEWELILKNSKPGTRILLRSAAKEVDYFPDFVKERLDFEQINTSHQHQLDRVGTYASVYLGVVQ